MRKKRLVAVVASVGLLSVGSGGAVYATGDEPGGGAGGGGTGEEFEPLPSGFTVQPFAGEVSVPVELDQGVPPAVLSTAIQAAEGGTIDSVQIDFDDIVPVYEVGATDADGDQREVDVFADGTLEEIELRVEDDDAIAEIPTEVTDLLLRTFPDFEITLREQSLRPAPNGLLRSFFEFDGRTSGVEGQDVDVEINQRGTTILVEPASLQTPAFEIPTAVVEPPGEEAAPPPAG